MRKLMVFLMVLVLAQLAKATEFGYITLEVKLGSSVGDVYYAHPEVQSLGLYVYSNEYHEAWEKVDGPTDFNRLKPGMHNFPVTKIIEQEAQAVGVPTSLPAIDIPKTEGVKDEPKPEPIEEIVPEIRKYESSGLINFNLDQYEKVEWPSTPQRPEPASALEKSVSAQASAQIATRAEPIQEVELLMPVEKPEAFTVKAEEKIADQNQVAYKRLSKRSYPRESFLVTNLPYLFLFSLVIMVFIATVIFLRQFSTKLAEYKAHFRARGPSPREEALGVQVEELQNSLKQTEESIVSLKRENEWYRQKLNKVMATYEIPFSGRKKVYLEVTSRRPGGKPFQVFFPGLDRDVVYDDEVLFEALIELINKPEEIWRKHINLPKEVVTALKGSVELKEKRRKLAQESQPERNRAREFAHAGRI